MENIINEQQIRKEIEKRRTFAIISHPDAGIASFGNCHMADFALYYNHPYRETDRKWRP